MGAALDRVAAELGRELAQVEVVGADSGAVAAGITLSLATDGVTSTWLVSRTVQCVARGRS